MATTSFMLAGLAVLALAGGAAWGLRRRVRPAPRGVGIRATADTRPVPRTGVLPASAPASDSPPTGVRPGLPPMRELLHRLYALGFDETFDDGAVPGADHAAVMAGAASVLAKIETQPRYTPRRPQLLPQLMRTVNDAGASARAIAAVIARDPALAGTLLRVANSALYRVQAKPVESIERAVALVGTDGIRHIIATALVQPVMHVGTGAFGRLPAVIWDHTLLAAVAAADHAALVEREDAFAAQMLGLLQGLGGIVVVQVARDQYARRPGLDPDAGVAAALLDDWAAPTARRIAERWELSERIGRALDDQRDGGEAGDPSPLGRSLRFGLVAGAFALLVREGRMDDAEARGLLAVLEPNATAVARIWGRLRREEVTEPATA